MDTPVFLFSGDNKTFGKKTKDDIIATIEFLYSRGMWSKFHYENWLKEAQEMSDAEELHLWWDSIVAGAMFEIESPLEERIEKMSEPPDGKQCTSKMKKMHKKNRNLDLD